MRIRQKLTEHVQLLDKYIILDMQGGYQDVIAAVATLKLALKYSRKVIGITCCTGRRQLENSVRDALIAQQIAGTQVPVYKGSTKSLLLREDFPQCVDQGSIFPELDKYSLDQKYQALIQKKPAAIFIEQSIHSHKKQLCVVSLGPLTNLSLAYHLNIANARHNQISSVRINGGSYSGVGNVIGHPSSQANFYFDPEAAHIILSNYKHIYVNPIERSLETDLSKEVQTILKNESLKGPKEILKWLQNKNYVMCGPLLTVLSIFNHSLAATVIKVYSEAMKTGNKTTGMMTNNWLRLEVKEGQQVPNTKIFTSTDRALLLQLLEETFA